VTTHRGDGPVEPHQRGRADPFTVDLQAAGVPLAPEVLRGIDDDAALCAERDEIAALDRWWQEHAPPLRPPAMSIASRRPRRWWGFPAGALAVAAAGLFSVGPEVSVRARGSGDVEITRHRDGALLESGAGLRPGDELDITVVPVAEVHLTVATIEATGDVSLLVIGAAASPERPFHLPGRIRLDDHPGQEWLVVWAGESSPATESSAVEAARDLLPDPLAAARPPALWVAEITREAP
jgi:hypothetical protein